MFELLHPGLLWCLALAAPLIALYILKARRRRREVSAAWLWQAVHKDLEARLPFRRLRRDWLLLLQLLILILLAVAAAGPFRRLSLGPASQTAVVLDASASLLPLLANPTLEVRLPCYSDTMVPKNNLNFSHLRSLRVDGWKYILAPRSELGERLSALVHQKGLWSYLFR